MAGSEDRGPSDDNNEAEWSDFSSNSSTTNTLDSLPFSLRSLDPIFLLNTLISCFPRQSDSSAALSSSDRAPNTSGTNDRILDGVDASLTTYGDPLVWRGSQTEAKYSRALNLLPISRENKLPSWQLKEDGEYASSRTLDFHKFAENFKAQCSDKRWSSDSNGLEQDFTSAKSTGQPSLSCDSDNENDEDDEIFLVFRGKPNSRLSSFDECQAAAGLSELSNGELLDLKQEMAAYVKEYSDVLIEELTLREELEREKEVKNKFISTLLTVQSKIRELQAGQTKGKKGFSTNSGKYLTTVIPYDDFDGGPSTKVLLQLIEIMDALLADSPTVPGLLTEYILKVLCAED
ncbi:fasciculation and elongation protein zeta-2-like [Porites lutea]|uniref:fasciculation and elongation protein zeta-2-like n=1 Tax=Porites lutea TaxID=51062 RepID=UPI003CC65D6D